MASNECDFVEAVSDFYKEIGVRVLEPWTKLGSKFIRVMTYDKSNICACFDVSSNEISIKTTSYLVEENMSCFDELLSLKQNDPMLYIDLLLIASDYRLCYEVDSFESIKKYSHILCAITNLGVCKGKYSAVSICQNRHEVDNKILYSVSLSHGTEALNG